MSNQELLKAYSAYLPYEVKVMFEGEDIKHSLVGLDTTSTPVKLISYYGDYGQASFEFSKLVLRPLSDLTKEIEHNGEKFVPIDYLHSDLSPNDYFGDTDNFEYLLSWIKSKDKSHHVKFLPYGLIKQLQEWHFDTEGLLDKNLAININDLKDE